jgi:hypothetical protein
MPEGLKMPDFSNLKLPDAPDLSSLQLPDAPDLSSFKMPDAPDMSNLKLPDAPDFSGLKLPDAPDLSSLTSSLPPNPLAVQPASALEYDPSSLAAPDLSSVKMPEIDLSSVKLPELDSAALLSKLTEAAAPLVKARAAPPACALRAAACRRAPPVPPRTARACRARLPPVGGQGGRARTQPTPPAHASQALSSAGIDLSSIDEKALTSSATELANSATGLASGAANDAITTAGSFSGEVWTPLGVGVIGAVALGAVAEREDAVGTARPAGPHTCPRPPPSAPNRPALNRPAPASQLQARRAPRRPGAFGRQRCEARHALSGCLTQPSLALSACRRCASSGGSSTYSWWEASP